MAVDALEYDEVIIVCPLQRTTVQQEIFGGQKFHGLLKNALENKFLEF